MNVVKVNKLNKAALVVHKQHSDFRLAAIIAHGDQRYGDFPYAYHLAAVEHILIEYGFSSHDYRAAAWLHDAVEDTRLSAADIASAFNGEIAMMVWACTGEGADRKERIQCIYKRLKEVPHAAPVKVADRTANITMSLMTGNLKKLKMYLDEFGEFKTNVAPLMVGHGDRAACQMWNDFEDFVSFVREGFDKIETEELKNEQSTSSE